MKFNQWTLALASVGIVSLGSVAQAEEQHSLMTALSSTTISGYVDTSASWWAGTQNRGGALNLGLPGRTFDGANKQDGFNLNAVKLVLEKPLGDATTWSAGYKADLVFGPDADYYASRNTITGTINRDNFSVKQAYVALRAPVGNGLDLKLGVWDTVIGYEFFEAGSNPNYSRSYGYALEPTHHTGLLASYKISDMFSISGGIANAYTGAVNDRPMTESKKTYLAAITVTLPESAGAMKNSVISVGYVGGQNGAAPTFAPANPHDTRSYYAGITLNTPLEGLQVGAAWDYRQDAAGLTANNVNDAYAVALYASYGMDKWKLNLRGDYVQGTSGTFYATPGDRNELLSITGDLDYSLWENVLTRLEVRYDRALSGDRPFGISQEQAVTVALNAIYKF
jgi:hypothetical protein